ncbi:tyrosine-protein phosphatase non-receptor type 18 [Scleropages formosus]|uniref:protein-tyrosine-phosphatase n=1 Tax=Scleropages formosus TaxID=113540 RepID=A0A8C9R3F4_SCLFO|nr:tyrosine-protein phosphatase non-receptor type 18-like [Scleropages formosus]
MEEHLRKFLELASDGAEARGRSEFALIRSQTAVIQQNTGLTTEAGALKENIKKNRYRDILPYDQSRVRLTLSAKECESDYINASFVQGAIENKLYIATQGPLKHTTGDFWRMVWQYQVKVIVMACRERENGKKKCECYWPDRAATALFGSFAVSNLNESFPNEEVVVRNLSVTYEDETRTVSQFQYTAWPDHGIPCTSSGILELMEMAHKVQGDSTAPIVIHCSAGCGRTGVICTVDYVNDLLKTKRISDDFNIMEVVLEIRSQRPSAVQTKEQYQFVYHIVAQMFEKTLLSSHDTYQNLTEIRQSRCGDVNSVKKREHQTTSSKTSDLQTRSKPAVKPRTSFPRAQNMNDTYAVVNKARQRPVSSFAVHHYDNADVGTASPAATAVYSTVKPKNRVRGSAPQLDVPVSDRAGAAANHWNGPSPSAEGDGDYEFVAGVFRTQSSTKPPICPGKKPSASTSSSEENYEYVAEPVRRMASQEGGMGFNCRVKKPKGPRDPPPEWSRAER